MKKIKFIIVFLLLFMIIGFATITVTLSINSNTKISSDVDDFKVYFSDFDVDMVTDLNAIKSDTEIIVDVVLDSIGDTRELTYEVTNASKMFDAEVTISLLLAMNI